MHNIRNRIEYTFIILEIRLSTHTFSPRYATDVNSMGAGRMICRVGAQKIFSFQGRGVARMHIFRSTCHFSVT